MPNYYSLISTITGLAAESATPQTMVDAVTSWAFVAQSTAVTEPLKSSVTDFRTNLTLLFDDLLPQSATPTVQQYNDIWIAAAGSFTLVTALVELLKWRIDNNRLTNHNNLPGLMVTMLRRDDHAEIKRKGLQIRDVRLKAQSQQPPANPPVRQAPKPQVPPAAKPVQQVQNQDPIEALMSQMGDSTPESVAKLQAKMTEFLAKKAKAAQPPAEPSFEDDPPIE